MKQNGFVSGVCRSACRAPAASPPLVMVIVALIFQTDGPLYWTCTGQTLNTLELHFICMHACTNTTLLYRVISEACEVFLGWPL